ncbi:MAG: hypothetical protein ACTSQE_04295 [Candidatus Heimdallarchaeaceae archaeon]
MTRFEIYSSRDFIILETGAQRIGVLGFILFLPNKSQNINVTQRTFNLLDSIGFSYVLQIDSTAIKLFFIIKEKNVGDTLEKITLLIEKVERITSKESTPLLSLLNHEKIAHSLYKSLTTSFMHTKKPYVTKIGKEYATFFSILVKSRDAEVFSEFIYDLVNRLNCKIYISNQHTKNSKNATVTSKKGLLIFKSFPDLQKAEHFFNHIEKVSEQYKDKISCTLHFLSKGKLNHSKVGVLLGFSPYTFNASLWDEIIDIVNFIPVINKDKNIRMSEVRRYKEISLEEVTHAQRFKTLIKNTREEGEQTEKQQILPTETTVTLNQNSSQSSNLPNGFVTAFDFVLSKGRNIKKNVYDVVNNKKKEETKGLIEYGKILSDDEIESLIKKIPTTPS